MFDVIFMSVLLAASLVWFAYTMKIKLAILLKMKPDKRWDRIPDRIENTIRYAFAQKRLFKEPIAGLMHALIFWGFLILLARSISLIGRAYTQNHDWSLFFFWGGLDHAYTFIKDWTELVVIIMVLYAIFRRLIIRPKRLTLSLSAYLILGLILTLMVTDFIYDGARFALGHGVEEAKFAPIGMFVKGMFVNLPQDSLKILSVGAYWIHIITLLFFLNELPRSKHFHVITSIPNVFFSKLEPPGAIAPILDIENQESFGVSKATDLTWKQVFDGYTCTECGRCSTNCPAYLSLKPLNPKLLIDNMRDYVKEMEPVLMGKKEGGDKTLIEAVGEEVIWSCTTCRSCEENCPVLITHVDKVIDMRRYLVLMESKMNPEVATTLKNLENKGNPWGLAMGERGLWTKDLDVYLISEKEDVEWLYFLGCFGAFDDRNKKVVTSVIRLLQKAGVSFAILGPEEQCCGDPARRLGNEYLFQIQAQQNIEILKQYKVKKIVTACPHCMNTIKCEWPQFGGNFEVWHHSQLLTKLVVDGRLPIPQNKENLQVVYHDSCYLGRYNNIYEEPRQCLNVLPDVEVYEIKRRRENGMCCGGGGGLMFREEKIGERINRLRLKQLMESGVSNIATACPFCLVMLRDAVNETGTSATTSDIAEIMAKRIL